MNPDKHPVDHRPVPYPCDISLPPASQAGTATRCRATSSAEGLSIQGTWPQQGAGSQLLSVAILASNSGMVPVAQLATQPTRFNPS